jgi:hypothetical protein
LAPQKNVGDKEQIHSGVEPGEQRQRLRGVPNVAKVESRGQGEPRKQASSSCKFIEKSSIKQAIKT